MKRLARPPRATATRPEKLQPPSLKARLAKVPKSVVLGMVVLVGVVIAASTLVPVPEAISSGGAVQSDTLPDGSAWAVGMLRPDGLRLIVSGRDDAGAVLEPQQFEREEVRHGYSIAQQIPALLNKLYCWCGCENRGEHRSNLQCFEDKMAQDCAVCLGTAEIAYDMSRQGIDDAAAIQAAVDVHWGPGR